MVKKFVLEFNQHTVSEERMTSIDPVGDGSLLEWFMDNFIKKEKINNFCYFLELKIGHETIHSETIGIYENVYDCLVKSGLSLYITDGE